MGYNGNDAFLYTGGTMTDLNTLTIGPNPFTDLNVAYGISPNGHYIVGDGTVASTGYTYGFLLTAAIPGDANGDGKVDINDLTIVLAHYNQTGQTWANGRVHRRRHGRYQRPHHRVGPLRRHGCLIRRGQPLGRAGTGGPCCWCAADWPLRGGPARRK